MYFALTSSATSIIFLVLPATSFFHLEFAVLDLGSGSLLPHARLRLKTNRLVLAGLPLEPRDERTEGQCFLLTILILP